jgi:hypothetical protein
MSFSFVESLYDSIEPGIFLLQFLDELVAWIYWFRLTASTSAHIIRVDDGPTPGDKHPTHFFIVDIMTFHGCR